MASPASLVEIFVVDLGDEPAGRDGVDAHALEGELERQRLGDLHHAGLGGGIGGDALGDAEAEHRGDVDDGALLALAASMRRAAFLRPVEHRVEIDAEHPAPFLRRHLDRAARRCAMPALLTRMVTVPKAFSAASKARAMAARSVTSASMATALPPLPSISSFSAVEPVGAARHQRDGRAVVGQRPGKLHAQAAGGAGDQRTRPEMNSRRLSCLYTAPHVRGAAASDARRNGHGGSAARLRGRCPARVPPHRRCAALCPVTRDRITAIQAHAAGCAVGKRRGTEPASYVTRRDKAGSARRE